MSQRTYYDNLHVTMSIVKAWPLDKLDEAFLYSEAIDVATCGPATRQALPLVFPPIWR
jgi:hypothetical protein